MAEVIIYTTNYCPYCVKAKDLLKAKGAEYKEIDVTGNDKAREELTAKANGMKTVPQIFINGRHIGGYDMTAELDKEGKLDELLRAKAG